MIKCLNTFSVGMPAAGHFPTFYRYFVYIKKCETPLSLSLYKIWPHKVFTHIWSNRKTLGLPTDYETNKNTEETAFNRLHNSWINQSKCFLTFFLYGRKPCLFPMWNVKVAVFFQDRQIIEIQWILIMFSLRYDAWIFNFPQRIAHKLNLKSKYLLK